MCIKNAYPILVATLALAALISKYYLNATSGEHSNIALATVDYLGKFTHLTNFLVVVAFISGLLPKINPVRHFFNKAPVRAAISLYILVVAVVYYLLLADQNDHYGLAAVTDVLLHMVVPLLYLLHWLLFIPKRPMAYAHIPYWLIYPTSYTIFSITKGPVLKDYPYPFLDVSELGYGAVGINILGFTLLFAIGAALFISAGRVLPEVGKAESA